MFVRALLVRIVGIIAAAALCLPSNASATPGGLGTSTAQISAETKSQTSNFAPVSARSLLDEGGNMTVIVPQARVDSWTRDLRDGKTPVTLVPVRHLWIGEYELAQSQDPRAAAWHFAQVVQNPYASADLKGLARYDTAVALFYQGAYYKATGAFWKLLTGKTGEAHGVDKRRLALWYKEASACAGYHVSRSRMGIPEPPQIDPKCAAAALAVCLKQLGLPYDEASVSKVCKVTGEGSSLNDVLAAVKALGVTAHPFGSDDAGLVSAPKPLVTYVEHDHFIAVTGADKGGVTYLCSDCGPWPGGAVRLTWKQWHALEPSLYVAVSRPQSDTDKTLTALETGKLPAMPRIAMAGPGKGILPKGQEWISVAHALQPHLIMNVRPGNPHCGTVVKALHCRPQVNAPMVCPCKNIGPAKGEPVNAATGEEEYTPDPDLTVYNPTGPSVTWSRIYNSMRGTDGDTNLSDFGMGWSQSYNIGILVPSSSAPQGEPVITGAGGTAVQLVAVGMEAPTTVGATWDIVETNDTIASSTPVTNTVVASSLSPNSWNVSLTGSGTSAVITLTPPNSTAGYFRVRYTGGSGATAYSCPFYLATSAVGPTATATFSYDQDTNGEYSVSPTGTGATIHNEFVVFPNGSRVSFISGTGLCIAESGAPLNVECENGSAGKYYVIRFADQTEWMTSTTAAPNTLSSGSKFYPITQISKPQGNPINLVYSNVAGTGFPLLTGITDYSGSALLTINRAGSTSTTPPANTITSVTDRYNRTVQYGDSYHVWGNSGGAIKTAELDTVSQVAVGGTTALRYTYGYTSVDVLDTAHELAPFLGTIITPSENGGTTTYTATITYDQTTDFVSNVADANGNVTTLAAVTAPGGTVVSAGTPSYCTRVTVTGTGGAYTYYLTYDGLMNTTGQTDGNGVAVETMTYSDPNDPYRPSTVTNGVGKTWSYQWDIYGRPTKIETPRTNLNAPDHVHEYFIGYGTQMYSPTYTLSNYYVPLISGIQEDDKPAITFAYTDNNNFPAPPNLLKTIQYPVPDSSPSNPNGGFEWVHYTYDTLGNITQSQQPTQNNSSGVAQYNNVYYNYTSGGSEMLGLPYTVTDNNSKVWTIAYDSITHDLQSITDPSTYKTQYTFNAADQLQSEIQPATTQQGSGNATITYSRAFPDADPYSATLTDEAGATVRQLNLTYGPEGEARQQTGDAQPFTAAYDLLYRLQSLTDGNGNVTKYFYNTAGYLYQIAYPGALAGTSPLTPGHSDTFTFTYDNAGDVTQREDGRGNTTTYAYNDPEGFLSSITYPSAYSSSDLNYSYDTYGRLETISDGTFYNYINYYYDYLDDIVQVDTKYGPIASVKSVNYTHYWDGERATMTTPASTTPFTYSYDVDRRLNGLANPWGQTFAWTYQDNGWLASRTSASAFSTYYTYWPDGSMRNVKNTAPGAPASILSNFANIEHDGAGNTISLAETTQTLTASGFNHYFTYDTLGRLTKEQWLPVGNVGLSFDGTGYVSASDTNQGNFGTNDFTISLWVKTTTANCTLFAKRQSCNYGNFYRIVVSGGKLAGEVNNGSASNDPSFVGTKTINDGVWHHLIVRRQGATLQTFVDGSTTADATQALTTTWSFSTSTPFTLGMNACDTSGSYFVGQMDELRIYNYALSSSQIATLAASGAVTNGPQNCSLYWGFDTKLGSLYLDTSGNYGYATATGGVTSTTGSPSYGYVNTIAYDNGVANGAGNPTSFKGTTLSYNSDNQLTGISYDGDGNPTTRNGSSLTWDLEDRLTSAMGEGTSYRPDGLRGDQQDGTTDHYYLYDGDTPIMVMDGSGNWLYSFEYGASGYLGYNSPSLTSFPTMSGLGDMASEFSPTGAEYNTRYPMDAYGEWMGTGAGDNGYRAEVGPTTLQSPGGLISRGARFYDATTGRFLNRDPFGYGGGINLYGYADDDPVDGTDPSGLNVSRNFYVPPPSFSERLGNYFKDFIRGLVVSGSVPGLGGEPEESPIPLGFKNDQHYNQFTDELTDGLRKAGYGGTEPGFCGSSVTGANSRTGVPFGPHSDYDIALANPQLLDRAKELGIGLRSGGVRTGPLTDADLEKLGLIGMRNQLQKTAGREVNFMIYKNMNEALKRGSAIFIWPGKR